MAASGTSALAVVASFPSRPRRAPVDWRLLGDLCQLIAAEGDTEFLDMMAKRAQYHLDLLRAVKAADSSR